MSTTLKYFNKEIYVKNEKNEQMWEKKELAYVGRGLFRCLNYFFNTIEIRCGNFYSDVEGQNNFQDAPPGHQEGGGSF